METIKVKVKKLNENAVLPEYMHYEEENGILWPTDGAMDVTATSLEYKPEIDCYVYGIGLAFEIPKGYYMDVRLRGSNRKKDCYLANMVGLVDICYSNEVFVCVKNRDSYATKKSIDRINNIFQGIYNAIPRLELPRIPKTDYDAKDFNECINQITTNTLKHLLDIQHIIGENNSGMVNEAEKGDIDLKYAPYEVGERIAQIQILPFPKVEWEEVDEIKQYDRDGFGSTGR